MEFSPKLAQRISQLGTESAFEVLIRARQLEAQGKEVVHLEIGEPDFPSPPHVVEAAIKALQDGWTRYGPPAGFPELREAIAQHVSETRGIPADPAEVVITPGAKPVMFFVILAVVEPGSEVLIPDPGFPIYASMVRFVGATPISIPHREELDFGFDIDEVKKRIGKKTSLVILNSPHNPTGAVILRSQLEALAGLLADSSAWVLSDEIYRRLVYGDPSSSITEFPGMKERTVILDGFSKAYAMTGWRLGYGVMPPALAAKVALLVVNSNSCTASFTQKAGLAALQGDQGSVQTMLEEFRKRRQITVEGLNRIPGFRCRMPHGAFYAFPNITETGLHSKRLADLLLDAAGVATLAGSDFGPQGEGYLRLSYANSIENIQKALERIDFWVRRHSKAEVHFPVRNSMMTV